MGLYMHSFYFMFIVQNWDRILATELNHSKHLTNEPKNCCQFFHKLIGSGVATSIWGYTCIVFTLCSLFKTGIESGQLGLNHSKHLTNEPKNCCQFFHKLIGSGVATSIWGYTCIVFTLCSLFKTGIES